MKTTPDLSQEFHPQPKPLAKGKKSKQPLKPGKKTLAWAAGRQDIKAVFRDNGIVECEIHSKKCKPKMFLGFAHTRRRVNLTEDQVIDPHFVVLACEPCHYHVDFEMQKHEAEILLDAIVKSRGW